MKRLRLWPVLSGASAVVLLVVVLGSCAKNRDQRAMDPSLEPPQAPREFRAAWVATVANIDWPSRRGLSVEDQKKELLAILDKSVELNLNALIVQVRPAADALYASELEPWSEYLTGEQGKAPEPFYDPLKMWVEEAHQRGIELHVWLNPYRARHPSARAPDAAGHVANTRPEIVKKFYGYEWIDPGEEAAAKHTVDVFMDVVKRYDIDGVHMDDYFYPYPDYLKDPRTKEQHDFPDEPSWRAYQERGGKLSRADWRRDNVNRLVETLYEKIKGRKKHVLFGISPFGIARPGEPPEVKSSFDQYEKLYADAKLWLNKGWCDYYTPQLYWPVESPQPYPALLDYWIAQNHKKRHVWPGNFTSKVADGGATAWTKEELVRQIEVTRSRPGASGNVHFSMKALMRNAGGVADALKSGPYAEPALVPATRWLDGKAPGTPAVRVNRSESGGAATVEIKPAKGEAARVWAVYVKYGETWKMKVVPGGKLSIEVEERPEIGPIRVVAVSAVDRNGNESRRAVVKLQG